MLSLQNFDREISSAMLQRGKLYYAEGYVTGLEEVADQQWTAEVEGSETYQVEITLGNSNSIKQHSCDCPYDGSPCKHEVAVFFALRDELGKQKTKPSGASKKDLFQTLLQSISLKEYQNFIALYAAKSKGFKTDFELFFADKDTRIDVGEKYAGIIKKVINKHVDRGYIDYRSTISLAREVDALVNTGLDYLAKNNFKDAFALAQALLKPVIEAMTGCDDSSGSIGGSIENIIDLFDKIASAGTAATDLKEKLLVYLQNELADSDYFDYGDFGYHLLGVFQNLAVQLNKTSLLLQWLDTQLKKLKPDSYRRQDFVERKIALLHHQGNIAEAESITNRNLDLPEIRKGEVRRRLDAKDYAAAKAMIADGIKIAENLRHPGTVTDWQKQLLEIAKLEKDIPTIRQYTKRFAFDHWFSGDDHYGQWKATYPPDEWKTVIENHIVETIAKITDEWKKEKYWRPAQPALLHKLGPIYIREQYLDRLLVLVQQENDLTSTLHYHEYLIKDYPAEMLAIYLPALEAYGHKVSDRGGYADLVQKMQFVIKSLPDSKEQILALALKLKMNYSTKPRRPAMVEELDKVLEK